MFKFKNEELLDKYEDMEDQYNDLCYEVDNAEDEIDSLNDEIDEKNDELEEYLSKIKEIKTEIQNHKNRITEIEKDLPQKRKQRDLIGKEYEKAEKELDKARLKEFQEYVRTLNETNAMFVELKSNTKTVKLLDFEDSRKDFLVLRNQYYSSGKFYSLIITKYYRELRPEMSEPTMTEIKKTGSSINSTEFDRLEPLLSQIAFIDKNLNDAKDGDIIPFDTLYMIGGQTSDNRTGYGTIWLGGGDYEEGTLYGEVTEFMAVGLIYGWISKYKMINSILI